MTWKNAAKRAVEKELQPMRQATYWVIYVSCALVFALKTVETSAMASYRLIEAQPQLAEYSTLLSYVTY